MGQLQRHRLFRAYKVAQGWRGEIPFVRAWESLNAIYSLLYTMTKWSGAALFIFQLWPGASDTSSRQREMKRGCGSYWRCTLSAERLGLSSSCVGTAFWMQTMWLQNVGQARKEACTAKLWLKKLSTNFPWRGFRSFDVFEREGICMTVVLLLSVRMVKDKSGLVQLGCYFLKFWP